MSQPIWGGRFEDKPGDITLRINESVSIDRRLYRQDIAGSVAHCRMLVAQGILAGEDGRRIEDGLQTVLREIEDGTFVFKTELEDVHMNIEARLAELIGDAAGRLHTARSRNDQVATDLRLWLKEAVAALDARLAAFQDALNAQAAAHMHTIMPGFTHLQIAQPVTLERHLQAYADMAGRDRGRFADCLTRLDESPLGACALAGTSFPIDRAMTAVALGFARPVRNTLDAVAARDFVLEFLAAGAICASHLSRLAEELVLWSTTQFGYIALSGKFTTGSSIMPQKKNPDAAELVRAKSGRMTGNLMQLLMVMKALPLAYNKDMQEDKAAVFDSFDTLALCLEAMTGMIGDMTVNTGRMRADAENGYAMATALADWLVRELGLPFRHAHHVTGRIVKLAEARGVKLHELKLADMQAVEPGITAAVFGVLRL